MMRRKVLVATLAGLAGIGIGALVATHSPFDLSKAAHVAPATLTEQFLGGDPADTDPQQLARVLESLVHILDEEIKDGAFSPNSSRRCDPN